MASSYITKDGVHGFWVHDGLLQIICWGMVSVIDRISDINEEWLQVSAREYYFHASQGVFVGFTSLCFDEYLIDSNRTNIMNRVIDETKLFFREFGEHINAEVLNDFQKIDNTRRRWSSPFETKRIIRLLDYIGALVNDEYLKVEEIKGRHNGF